MAAYVASPERSGNAATQHKVAQRSSPCCSGLPGRPPSPTPITHTPSSARTQCAVTSCARTGLCVRCVCAKASECTRVLHVRAAAARSIHRYPLLDRGSLGCSRYCRYQEDVAASCWRWDVRTIASGRARDEDTCLHTDARAHCQSCGRDDSACVCARAACARVRGWVCGRAGRGVNFTWRQQTGRTEMCPKACGWPHALRTVSVALTQTDTEPTALS